MWEANQCFIVLTCKQCLSLLLAHRVVCLCAAIAACLDAQYQNFLTFNFSHPHPNYDKSREHLLLFALKRKDWTGTNLTDPRPFKLSLKKPRKLKTLTLWWKNHINLQKRKKNMYTTALTAEEEETQAFYDRSREISISCEYSENEKLSSKQSYFIH